MNAPYRRIGDSQMQRSLEMLDAIAARRSPITLRDEQVRILLGRLTSLLVTAGQIALDPDGDSISPKVLAEVVLGASRDILLSAGFTPEELDSLLRQMLRDASAAVRT